MNVYSWFERLRFTVALFAIGVLGAMPAAVTAQPTYAQSEEEGLRGAVASFEGAYTFTVHDNRGYLDHIRLHHGTAITPIGVRLTSGMEVLIYGRNSGAFFDANEIHVIDASDVGAGSSIPVYSGFGFVNSVGVSNGYSYTPSVGLNLFGSNFHASIYQPSNVHW